MEYSRLISSQRSSSRKLFGKFFFIPSPQTKSRWINTVASRLQILDWVNFSHKTRPFTSRINPWRSVGSLQLNLRISSSILTRCLIRNIFWAKNSEERVTSGASGWLSGRFSTTAKRVCRFILYSFWLFLRSTVRKDHRRYRRSGDHHHFEEGNFDQQELSSMSEDLHSSIFWGGDSTYLERRPKISSFFCIFVFSSRKTYNNIILWML
jgi:hypothetical protein